ncbi:hypothetical protein U1E44_07335 [Arenibacter sp. GZD96]|uniref:hypothetical protein n=1 Tax=Aurantibrevibacter litoralis TaxID=3106030 RepID=UPI002AFF8925|nr:hypothetical protein [Arenibacter sp. GZD-96]MEA1785899.1 hypothetical protein [Arenibacter sp. GZD-96]
MKTSLFLLFCFCSGIFCIAQQRAQFGNLPSGASPQDNLLRVQPAFNQFFVHLKGTETTVNVSKALGTPFEDENFSKGQLYDKDEFLGDFYLRYNAYDDQIELKKTTLPEETVQGLVKNSNFRARYKNVDLSYRAFTDTKGTISTGYLHLLVNGSSSKLFKRLKAIYVPATTPINPQTRPTPSRFVQFETFFVSLNGIDQIMEMPQQTSKFIALFEKSMQSTLRSYMKENKLKLKEEKDLIVLFNYINTTF